MDMPLHVYLDYETLPQRVTIEMHTYPLIHTNMYYSTWMSYIAMYKTFLVLL